MGFGVPSARLLKAALDSEPELDRSLPSHDHAVIRWRWRWQPPARNEPGGAPGVLYRLSPNDSEPRPCLAEIERDLRHEEVWLLAATPKRLALAERLLNGRIGALLGSVSARQAEPPKVTPRWKRGQREGTMDVLAPIVGPERRRAA